MAHGVVWGRDGQCCCSRWSKNVNPFSLIHCCYHLATVVCEGEGVSVVPLSDFNVSHTGKCHLCSTLVVIYANDPIIPCHCSCYEAAVVSERGVNFVVKVLLTFKKYIVISFGGVWGWGSFF